MLKLPNLMLKNVLTFFAIPYYLRQKKNNSDVDLCQKLNSSCKVRIPYEKSNEHSLSLTPTKIDFSMNF